MQIWGAGLFNSFCAFWFFQSFLDLQLPFHLRIPLDDFFSISMGCGMDGQYNERSVEWSSYIRPIMRGLAFNPPLVMPYVGSMFKSDTAMLRPGTRYVQDLPKSAGKETLQLDPRCQGLEQVRSMPQAWREALDTIEAIMARAYSQR